MLKVAGLTLGWWFPLYALARLPVCYGSGPPSAGLVFSAKSSIVRSFTAAAVAFGEKVF